MKTIAIATVASIIAILPAAATPKAAPTPAPATATTDVPAAATRYCYNTEMTGSRITKRMCKTRADWQKLGVKVPEAL